MHRWSMILSALLVLLGSTALAGPPPETIRAGIVSAPGKSVLYKSPDLAMYVEFQLAPGPEPRQPRAINIWSTPVWVYEPFTKRRGIVLQPGRLNRMTGCAHSPELFAQLNPVAAGGDGRNDYSKMLPVAIQCDQGRFLLLLHRSLAPDTNNNFPTQMPDSFDWMTRKIRLIWWASREELIPLEDLSEMSDPKAEIEKRLATRSSPGGTYE